MDFNKQMPNWQNKGNEPSEELKATGFKAGNKPPANIFNWFWGLITDGIRELQGKLGEEETNRIKAVSELQAGKSDIGHKHIKEDISNFPTSLPANGGNADTVILGV